MRLAAVFIEDQDSDNGDLTINLGGFNYYDIKVGNGRCRINAAKNEIFVDNLFDLSNTVTNISAIVGNNGSGKTSLIYKVIDLLNGNYTTGFTIWEDRDRNVYINNYRWTIPISHIGFTPKPLKKEIGTIYYSPYLDHKIRASGIDISADRYLREDLVNIDSTYDANTKVVISERLKRADYKRFIKFQKSKFAKKVIAQYGLLNDNLYKVVFIRHKIKTSERGIDFDETPDDFRDFLFRLFSQIQSEYDSINRSVATDVERYELHKNLFKNIILMDLFCLLIRLMEKSNFYLQEGHFDNREEAKEIINSNLSATVKFEYWLRNYHYSKGGKHPLPDKEVLAILYYLNNYIDNLEYGEDVILHLNWGKNFILFEESNLNELLDLNESLLAALPKYYLATENGDKNIFDSVSELQHFVSPEFAERRLSSGETAMLNLYSRLYDFFSRHILDIQTIKKEDYYLLFLDEADLGYHPSWKRSFVNTVIEFSIDFFKELGAKVQIVFTTHDPLSLSDIPNTNVIYLHSEVNNRILGLDNQLRPSATFAANVNDLLGHSFFLDNLLIGDFANSKIKWVIKWINSNRDKNGDYNIDEFTDVKKIIKLIEEPVLRNKLVEMLSDIEVDEVFINDMIEKQTNYLRDILRRNHKK
ncbi:AAA family ATPase [Winogradskyella helgolandensis]|uniref:AAA family ATPase n=1 Tax=Winogradskyella helgolandensis TaxID=2697010 RepID=UPI0015C7BC8C|nr:AAA family ATPase [Winogradskyella helgolandensis]